MTIKLDKTKPTLAPVVNNNRPLLNATGIVATPNGADALSGIASQSCDPVSTAIIGTQNVNCTATDMAGNVYTKLTSYRVVYGFVGFTGDVVNPGSSNSAVLGQGVNFNYRLVDANGNGVTGASLPTVTSAPRACPTVINNVVPVSADPSGLQDLGNGYYRFVWTAPGAPLCTLLTVNMGDGETTRRAIFRFQ